MNLITIQTVDGTVARSMLGYDTYENALSALYSTMASSTANPNLSSAVCILMSDDGHVDKCEKFSRTIAKPNPIESEEE